MRAAVLFTPNEALQVVECELDPPKAGAVRVRVKASGVCQSDWHIMNGDWPSPMRSCPSTRSRSTRPRRSPSTRWRRGAMPSRRRSGDERACTVLALHDGVHREEGERHVLRLGPPPRPRLPVLVHHYMNKRLNIDGLISRTYELEEIDDGCKRMLAGEVARGVVLFD